MITFPEYKINNQTILQEQFDENYEPTQEEIREYAIYIGIDPDTEFHLLWLAKEGILKPLPPGWKPCQEENGELYYFNFDTGRSSWDHPCDEIYKARVIEERQKPSSSSSSTNLLDTNPRGTLTQTGRTMSTVSDYLSGGKKPSTLGANHNTPVVSRNVVQTNKFDSQYVNSDNDDIEEELMHSDDDDDEQSSDDFRRKVDFGIDPLLSARIEREEKEAITTSALAASRSLNSMENTDRKKDNQKDSIDDGGGEDNERKKRAALFAQVATRRLSHDTPNKAGTTDETLITPREEHDLTHLRTRLEQSANEEKLQILEDNQTYLERLRNELRLAKEKQEQTLRDKMKADLASIENEMRESIARERKSLESRKQDDLNNIKQTVEKEKDELQRKLRASMHSDVDVYKNALEQQSNTQSQVRSLQDQLARQKNEFEEKLRYMESRYKNETDDLTRRYEQAKADREKLEKHLKEKDNLYSTLQRTTDQLRADKLSVERKLQDAEAQLKAIDNSNRQVGSTPITRKSLPNTSDNEDDDDDDDENENLNLKKSSNQHQNGFHADDELDRLSDTDSDVVEMEQTLKQLRQTQLEYMSLLPISNMDEKANSQMKSTRIATVDFTKLSVADVGPVIRNIRTINRHTPRVHESFDTTSNQFLTDTGRWSNSIVSTMGNNTNSLSMYQTLTPYQSTLSKTNHWPSQPNLVTREAVLKAARRVFAPGVIDQLTSNIRSSTH